MILEIAEITIRPGDDAAFDAAIERGLASVVSKSPGYRSHRVWKGIESPERYRLLIEWDDLESHTEGFRGSPAFAEWRAIVGPFFALPPSVEHWTSVCASS